MLTSCDFWKVFALTLGYIVAGAVLISVGVVISNYLERWKNYE